MGGGTVMFTEVCEICRRGLFLEISYKLKQEGQPGLTGLVSKYEAIYVFFGSIEIPISEIPLQGLSKDERNLFLNTIML